MKAVAVAPKSGGAIHFGHKNSISSISLLIQQKGVKIHVLLIKSLVLYNK